MFICMAHAAPNEAQDILFAKNAPRLTAVSFRINAKHSKLTDCSRRFVPQVCSPLIGRSLSGLERPALRVGL